MRERKREREEEGVERRMKIQVKYLDTRYRISLLPHSSVLTLKTYIHKLTDHPLTDFCLYYGDLCLGHDVVMPPLLDPEDKETFVPRFRNERTLLEYYRIPANATIHMFIRI